MDVTNGVAIQGDGPGPTASPGRLQRSPCAARWGRRENDRTGPRTRPPILGPSPSIFVDFAEPGVIIHPCRGLRVGNPPERDGALVQAAVRPAAGGPQTSRPSELPSGERSVPPATWSACTAWQVF